MNQDLTQLVSAGADGAIMRWRLASDSKQQPGLELASACVLQEPLSSIPAAVIGIECLGAGTVLASTTQCAL
jgi:hypothetical protein